MASDPRQVQQVFLRAVELPREDRPGMLDRACAGDAELRERVETLLLAHEAPGGFLDRPAAALALAAADGPAPPAAWEAPPAEGAGAHVGPYKLLEQIGEGGFGVVYMAEQQHPVRRKVALKVLKPGMDSRQV